MIISGRTAFDRGVLTDLIDAAIQVQPCGIDVTLKTVSKYTGPGTLDFSNTLRNISTTERMPFHPSDTTSDQPPFVHLPLGSYIMEFNETLHTPMDIMGHIYSRSSLWRSGGLIHGGVCDSGYSGAFGALLQVVNPHGIVLHQYARIAQAVFHEMGEGVGEGYIGTYQGAASVV